MSIIDDYMEMIDNTIILLTDLAEIYVRTGNDIKNVLSEYASGKLSASEVINAVNKIIENSRISQERIARELYEMAADDNLPRDVNIDPNLKVNDIAKYLFDSELEQLITLINLANIRKARWK